MVQEQEIAVRRARPGDADKIATFINQALQGRSAIAAPDVVERFGSAGFLLAEREDTLVGLLGWQAENLVARVTDFLIWPASERDPASAVLFPQMEQAAAALQCEVALLLLPRPTAPEVVAFFGTLGYEPQVVAGLPKAWREAAFEAQMADDDMVVIKSLRTSRVLRPL